MPSSIGAGLKLNIKDFSCTFASLYPHGFPRYIIATLSIHVPVLISVIGTLLSWLAVAVANVKEGIFYDNRFQTNEGMYMKKSV